MTVAMWAAVPLLAVVAVEDMRHRRIRNRHVLALAAVTFVVVGVLAIGKVPTSRCGQYSVPRSPRSRF